MMDIINKFTLDDDSSDGYEKYLKSKKPSFSPITISKKLLERIKVAKRKTQLFIQKESLYTETYNNGEITMSKEMVEKMLETLTMIEQRRVAIRQPIITRLDAMCDVLGTTVFRERIGYTLEKYPYFVGEYLLANR